MDAGLLRVVESRGAVLYDPNPDPTHHHFRCRGCDRLYDVHVEGVKDLKISGDREFVVDRKTILLGGLCPLCSSPARHGPPRRLYIPLTIRDVLVYNHGRSEKTYGGGLWRTGMNSESTSRSCSDYWTRWGEVSPGKNGFWRR